MTGRRWLAVAAALAVGAAASTALGFALGLKWLFPFLGAAVPYPVFLSRVRRRAFAGAVGWVLFWAVFQSASVGVGTCLFHDRAAVTVQRGPSYAVEMIHWVRTGEGEEGSPRLYLPIHLRHYLGFCVLSVITVGAAGLVLGTWLLNYMNFYVASLVLISARPAVPALFGWPVWAELRVAGFVVTGAALASLGLGLYRRMKDRKAAVRFPVRVFLIGFGLVAADAVLKWLLAPPWQRFLLRALTGR